MDHVSCAYCTGDAIGVDEDGEFTCGDCSQVAAPMPRVIEASENDEEDV